MFKFCVQWYHHWKLKVSWTEFLFNDWITALRIILYACSFLFSMWQYIWITRIIENLLWLLWTSHVSAKPFWSTCINGNISAGLLFLLLESDFKVEMLRVRSLTLIKTSCAVRFSHLKVFWTHFFFYFILHGQIICFYWSGLKPLYEKVIL